MTDTQDNAVVEPQAEEKATQDVPNVEATQETQDQPEAQADGEQGEQQPEAVEETPEQRLERLERDLKGKQKAIDRKTAAYSDLQRAHERTLERLRELEQAIPQQKQEAEPQLEQFETYDDYIKARDEYVEKRAISRAREQALREQAQAEVQRIAAERQAIVNKQEQEYLRINPKYVEAKQEMADFVQRVRVKPEVEAAVTEVALKGDVPRLIDYYFGNGGENVEEFERLVQMSPYEAAIEVYKVQSKLSQGTTKQVQTAPKPVRAPQAAASAQKKDVSAMSPDELYKKFIRK